MWASIGRPRARVAANGWDAGPHAATDAWYCFDIIFQMPEPTRERAMVAGADGRRSQQAFANLPSQKSAMLFIILCLKLVNFVIAARRQRGSR